MLDNCEHPDLWLPALQGMATATHAFQMHFDATQMHCIHTVKPCVTLSGLESQCDAVLQQVRPWLWGVCKLNRRLQEINSRWPLT